MSGELEAIARKLEAEGQVLEAKAVRVVQAAYGRLRLVDLLALLEALTARDTSTLRIAGLDQLLGAFDRGVQTLKTPPPEMTALLQSAVESGIGAGSAMLKAGGLELDAFRVPPELQSQFVERSTARFVQYWGIERTRYLAAVQSSLLEGLDRGSGAADVAAQIRNRTGESKTRSLLIARTELGRASSYASQQTQQHAGLTEFVWRATKDKRTRDTHRARDGRIYRWDEPPGGELPGQPFNCRCVALAVIPEDGGPP